jgi:hypothetical protein
VLQVDSYGQAIYAENQGTIELTVADGSDTSVATLNNGHGALLLDAGATINMSSPDGVDRGDLELNVPRTGVTSGNIRIAASGPLNISGAQTIAVNAFWTYAPTDPDGTIAQSVGPGVPKGAVILDQADQDSLAFIANAESNGTLNPTLASEMAGLTVYQQAFHLRPGTEIVSRTPTGNLTVQGDLDLSKYRYASVNPNSPLDSVYGSGEPGVLILRAGGNLYVYGSISDGFAPLALNGQTLGDEKGWVLFAGKPTLDNVVINTTGIRLVPGTTFPDADVSLNYAVDIGTTSNPLFLNAGVTIPATVTLSVNTVVTQSFVATADIRGPTGKILYAAGKLVPAGAQLPAATTISSGSVLPFTITIQPMVWPAGASLAVFSSAVTLASNVTLQPGDLIPGGSVLQFGAGIKSVATRPQIDGIQGQIYAVEPMLALGPGGQEPVSWSIRLVAGADTEAADTQTLQAQSALNGSGNLVLDDPHISLASDSPIFSVIRTGTGYLDLLAGGNFTEDSLYGVYTAGARTLDTSAFNQPRGVIGNGAVFGGAFSKSVYEYIATTDYQAYYPDQGGNVLVSAQGNLTGFTVNSPIESFNVSDWLWTQGGSGIGQNAAWWINFGTYVSSIGRPAVAGFVGIGALGGGNVTVIAGGNAGVNAFSSDQVSSGALVIAVGATGRVTSLNGSGGGTLLETGGGNATIEIGGALNPVDSNYTNLITGFSGGEFIDLRGNINVHAGSIGGIDLVYGQSSATDPRPTGVSTAAVYAYAYGGPELAPGDGTINLQVRGDLVIADAVDPGIIVSSHLVNTTQASLTSNPSVTGDGDSWFSLWTNATAINAVSAGGNIVPTLPGASNSTNGLFPTTLHLFATSGSVYAGGGGVLELAPSPTGQLEILAEDSIYANALLAIPPTIPTPLIFEVSGAAVGPNDLPGPFDPAYFLIKPGTQYDIQPKVTATNTIPTSSAPYTFGLFGFELDSASGALHADNPEPARFYAVTGDIVDLQFGQIQSGFEAGQTVPEYIAGEAADIRAGGDIVNFGQSETNRSLILNNSATDVSVLSAGNDILFANVDIAGPGNLEISAGGNIYQGSQGALESIGLIGSPKLQNPDGGAGIIVLAGADSQGPGWNEFASLYLNGANLANPDVLLINQPGKVVETYQDQLLAWLQQTYNYPGSMSGALAYFQALPVEQRSVFLLTVFFSELNESGLDYNDPTSAFFQSYLRGQAAIAALFPSKGANGQPITYSGNLTMFSSENAKQQTSDSSILTDFGGGITILVPGGETIVGVTGVAPGPHAGILTQGSGNINVYSHGSILLGESRILTTFGGNIVMWSATGDINAGIGAKGTIIFAPPGIVYDNYADILLSPTVPSSGAGIGTLDPIPEVPPGDLNLIAPEGTIDAGEAGIRASGNANLAARVIVNAANITVAGKTTGIPTIVSPNVAAVTAASNAVGATNNVAQEVAKQQTAGSDQQGIPSIITVEILGYGGGDSD